MPAERMRLDPAESRFQGLQIPVGLVSLAFILACLWGITSLHSQSGVKQVGAYLILMAIACLAMVLGQSTKNAISPWIVWLGSLSLHFILLLGHPLFEDDFFRYLWDGYRTLSAGSPYGIAPEHFFGDPNVPAAMRRILSGVNNPEAPTIYGAVLQYLFALSQWLFPNEERALRALFSGINLVLVWALIANFGARRTILYAWNPLVLTEIALNGHPDGVLGFCIFAAWLCYRAASRLTDPRATTQSEAATQSTIQPSRKLIGSSRQIFWLVGIGVALGAAAGVKIVALAIWPILIGLGVRRYWPAIFAACMSVVIFYLPFIVNAHQLGLGLGADGAILFATRWEFNPMLYAWIQPLISPGPARLICAIIGIGAILWLTLRARRWTPAISLGVFGLVLFVSPAFNAWYLLWLLPFAVTLPAGATALISLALAFSYATGLNLGWSQWDGQFLSAFSIAPPFYAAEVVCMGLAMIVLWAQSSPSASRQSARGIEGH